MKHLNRCLKSVWILGFLLMNVRAFSGEVVICKQLKGKSEHRCVIETKSEDNIKKGNRVVLYTAGSQHWVATGKIRTVKGRYAVAVFENADPRIRKGLTANFESIRDASGESYDLAFKNPARR